MNQIKSYIQNGYILRKELPENSTIKPEDFKKPVVAVIIACRLKSMRLANKALLKIGDLSSIEMCIKNSLKIKEANHVILATSQLESDSELKKYLFDPSGISQRGS